MRGGHLPVIPLFLALSLLAPIGYAVEYAGGTGEPNDPYLIATAEQLLQTNFSTPGIYFRLCRNIDFTGGVNSCRVGMLAGTSKGVIENCSATGSITVGEKSRFVGGLIGYDFGQVRDCDATVTIKAGEGSTDIGDLVGVL